MVVAAREDAARHGPGVLIVDGSDAEVFRSAQFSFTPSRGQEHQLHGLLRVCREVPTPRSTTAGPRGAPRGSG